MRIKGIGMLDIDAERAHWQCAGGLPSHPHSANWDVLVSMAATVLLANPDGNLAEWLTSVKAKLQGRGSLIPDIERTAITTVVLERMALQTA